MKMHLVISVSLDEVIYLEHFVLYMVAPSLQSGPGAIGTTTVTVTYAPENTGPALDHFEVSITIYL